jgi:membrane protease YdiL (CAAX protease family)
MPCFSVGGQQPGLNAVESAKCWHNGSITDLRIRIKSMGFFILIIPIGYLGGTIYLANVMHRDGLTTHDISRPLLRWLLYSAGGLTGLLALSFLMAVFAPESMVETNETSYTIGTGAALTGIVLTFTATFLIFYFIQSANARQRLSQLISKGRGYDPDSLVHLTAIVLSLLVITGIFVSYWLSGGTEAAAEAMSQISGGEVLLQNLVWVMVAFLGVGFAIRRGETSTLRRLDLRIPNQDDWVWGVGVGMGLLVVSIIIGLILTAILDEVGSEAAENQVETLASLGLPTITLLLIAIAIGEELFFRGAMQPVFGNVLVTLFFVSMHTQTLFAPLILGLVAVSLILGWLRDRHSTSAAIIAHFCYNFIVVGLQMIAPTT